MVHNFELSFPGRISGIIVAGGCGRYVMDFLTGDLGIKLPNLHRNVFGSSMVSHNGTILLCGGQVNSNKCLQMDHGTWKKHSTLNKERAWHSAVTTQTATFVFGGSYSDKTYEYLPKDSTEWIMGKTGIPGGFSSGCAIAVKSGQEIWLIGGLRTEKRILSFNVNDHKFKVMPFQLNVGRDGLSCALIPNTNKIMITGGYSDYGYLDSAEVLDTKDGSVTMASPMTSKRCGHGMGVVTINGEDRLVVFGGRNENGSVLDCVELYNTKEEKWEKIDIKLKEPKYYFGFQTVKLSEIISKL